MGKTINKAEVKRKRQKRIALKAVNDYIYYLTSKKQIIKANLLAGVMRGLGTAIGFWVLSAVVIAVLSYVAGSQPFVKKIIQLFEDAVSRYSG